METTRQKFCAIGLLTAMVGLGVLGVGCKPPGARAMFKGEAMMQAGRPKAAVAQFELATRHLPTEWRVWNFLGMARHRAGDLAGADKAYQEAKRLVGARRFSPKHPSFVLEFNIGRLCLDRGRNVEAENHLITYATQNQSFPACFWLAEAYRANAHHSAAVDMLRRALKAKPNSAVTWNRLGVVQVELGDAVGAMASFDTALKHQKDFAEARRNLAITLHQHAPLDMPDRDANTLRAFKDYLALEPADAAAVQHVADELEARIRLAAETAFPAGTNQVAGLNPNAQLVPSIPPVIPEPPLQPLVQSNFIVQLRLPTNGGPATVIRQPGAVPQIVPREDTVAVKPSVPPTPPPTPPIKTPTPPGKIAKVIPQPRPTVPPPVKTVRPVRPEVPEVPGIARYRYLAPARPRAGDREKARRGFDRSFHLHQIQQLDAAIVGYREVLALDPGYQQAHLNLAIALHGKGEIQKALPSYEVALSINPLSHKSRQGFAAALNASKFFVDAAKEYETLLEKFPANTTDELVKDRASAHMDLAGVYANQLKLPDRAKRHYRDALRLNPNHGQAPAVRVWLSQNP
jgi:tetratricopeptide (TPR) repeat protein